VGGSILLNQFGLVDRPNDIDILVDINDIDRAHELLKSIGHKMECESTATFSTKYFYKYIVNGIDVDVMAGFAINHSEGVYEYIFDRESIAEFRLINGVNIPFASLEDWYVLYQLIPNRKSKVELIEKHLLSNGIKVPFVLKRALKGNLPEEVREKIESMLSS